MGLLFLGRPLNPRGRCPFQAPQVGCPLALWHNGDHPPPATPPMASNPVFQTQDTNGLAWSFDPTSGKWSVQGEGPNGSLKSSSQKLDVLVGKARSWKEAQTAGPVAPKESVEVELMKFSTSLRDAFAPIGVGVRVRLEWDERKKGYAITKFRPHKEGVSWRTFQSDDLIVLDPFNLDPDSVAWIQSALTIKHLEERLLTTEHELANQWLGYKQEQARGIWFDRDGEIKDTPLEPLRQRSNMISHQKMVYLVGRDVPVHVVSKGNENLEGDWVTEPDGRVRLEKNKAWVRLCPPNLNTSLAQFEVGVGDGEASHVLYSTSDSKTAIALTKALTQTQAWDLPAVAAWEGYAPSGKGSLFNWPVAVQTKALFHLHGFSKEEEALFSLKEEGFLRSPRGNKQDNGWKIEAVTGNRYSIEKNQWNIGPEDVIPAQVAEFSEQAKALLQEIKANWSALLKEVIASKKDTLSAVVGALAEGEEPRSAQEVQQKWDRVCARLRKEVQDSEPAQRLEQLIDQTKQAIEHSLQPSPKRLKR